MAKTIQFTTPSGDLIEQQYPDDWTDERINADIGSVGGKRYESWSNFVYRHVVPQTPVEWAIFGASLPFGFGAGGLLSRIGAVGAKTTLGAVGKKLATGAVARTAVSTGAGAAGAKAEQLLAEEPTGATTLAQGAWQGFTAGLLGEGATKLMSGMNQVFMRRIAQRYSDPAAMNAWAREWMPELQGRIQQGPTAVYQLLLNHELHDAARAQLVQSIKVAEAASLQKKVVLPELNGYLTRSKNIPDYPPRPDALFGVQEAVDYLTGAELNEHLYRVTFDQIQSQVGPKASTALQEGLGRYGFYKEVERIFGERAKEIWAGGKMNLNPVREAIMESAGPAGKKVQDHLGKSWDTLLSTVFRGDIPAVLDKPARIGLTGVSGAGHMWIAKPSLGVRAGAPGAIPGGMAAPLTAVTGAQLGASLEGFIPGMGP